MRMFKKLLVAALLLSTITTPASAVDLPAAFSFHGSGYGHGVGMSQMGARSMALAGKTSQEILQYFFKDVAIEPLDDSKIIRVNIGHLLVSTKIATITQGAVLQIYSGYLDNQITTQPLVELSNKDALMLSILGSSVIANVNIGKKALTLERNKGFTIRWSGTRYLAGVDGLVSVAQSGGSKKYRYGQIQVRAVKDATLGYRLELTNSLRLADEYLWGVSEMQSSWPAAALEAQAIASRTYALSKVGFFKNACDCEIYSENSDQVFAGYAKEIEPKYGLLWKSAVTQSAGLAITQAGRPITPYFFSSSGGKTELAVNAWGSAKPYTQIVDDPGSLDISLNPRYVTWDRTVSQSLVAAAFLLSDVVSLEVLSRNASGTIGRIRATSSTGEQFTLRGETFRSRTKIPSAYCDLVIVQN